MLQVLLNTVNKLKDAADEVDVELTQQHADRFDAKSDHAASVLSLIETKLDELQSQEKVEEAGGTSDAEELTPAETERDVALRGVALTKQLLAQYQQKEKKDQEAALLGASANAAPAPPAPAANKFLNCTAVVQRDQLPLPLPDVGTVSECTKTIILAIHAFYADRQFVVLPPTSMQDLQADAETLYAMLGENIWKSFFDDHTLEADEALPTQLHSVIAHQARLAPSRLSKGAKGDKGDGKGKKDNGNY